MSRHSWDKSGRYAICVKCGCRYRQGVVNKRYEHADRTITFFAGECPETKVNSDIPDAAA